MTTWNPMPKTTPSWASKESAIGFSQILYPPSSRDGYEWTGTGVGVDYTNSIAFCGHAKSSLPSDLRYKTAFSFDTRRYKHTGDIISIEFGFSLESLITPISGFYGYFELWSGKNVVHEPLVAGDTTPTKYSNLLASWESRDTGLQANPVRVNITNLMVLSLLGYTDFLLNPNFTVPMDKSLLMTVYTSESDIGRPYLQVVSNEWGAETILTTPWRKDL